MNTEQKAARLKQKELKKQKKAEFKQNVAAAAAADKQAKKKSLVTSLTDYVITAIGSAVYALGLECFLLSGKISPGGITGIAAILDYLYGLPTGVVSLVLNIPLFILGIKMLGMRFTKRTIIATVLISVFLDLFDAVLPVYAGNRLLSAIYGGLISGAGLALIMLRGGSSGGVDIIAKIVSMKWPFISIGRSVLAIDMVVTAAAAVAYSDIETALYTIIALFVSSKVIDALIYGADKGKVVFIITTEHEKMLSAIFEGLDRGATVLNAQGGWQREQRDVIMCAVRIAEASRLQRIVHRVDPHAFMIMGEAGEIVGEGFKPL